MKSELLVAAASANDAVSGTSKVKNAAAAAADEQQRFVVELEDLGVEYLEELLRISES